MRSLRLAASLSSVLVDPPGRFLRSGSIRGSLRSFSPSEIALTDDEVRGTLRFFWRTKTPPDPITHEDRSFAQALLVEAIDRSVDLSFIERVFRKFYLKIPGSPRSTVLKVVRLAVEHAWFRERTRRRGIDPDEVRIYESVRAALARNFRTEYEVRLTTGSYPSYAGRP